MPELPEVEVTARLLTRALDGVAIETALAPGLNALRTFDPPLHALEGSTIGEVRRRGKLLLVEVDGSSGHLTLMIHLMSAGRLQLFDKRATLRDRTSRLLLRLPDERELRVREFGTRQAAWVKLLRPDDLEQEETLATLGPEAWPDPPEVSRLAELLSGARPLHSLLRDQRVIAGIGRTWVDDILHAAELSPFKRGDDLDDREVRALREAMVGELGRAVDLYTATWKLPLPDKQAKAARVHAHQGESCPRCDTVMEAVFYEDYVMTYCPRCQTDGRILKDRRLSRLLK
ncbi:MAG: DNA-formamidopyrimidine glycosylase [Solirubrobacterales bacterium]|nr:DNA-formamidopyrimidine glycosylase [Solirubrobacterales bacterium]